VSSGATTFADRNDRAASSGEPSRTLYGGGLASRLVGLINIVSERPEYIELAFHP